ncbi:unnamed protein product [Somion occarium]|uniref:Mini-chromosome maintenance complex-binding protein n=1 Tax=Somion occarium TaxID=3059160 RepID=A0ABP1D7V4_9APHY
MVSAFRADALRDPTEELKELYTTATSRDDFPAVVAAHFCRVFHSSDAFKEIPPLNVRHPPESYPDRSLVRFRAMVQDTSSSAEMYLEKYQNGTIGGWGIEPQSQEDDARHDSVEYDNLRECTVLWAISVPGESAWSSNELDGSEAGPSTSTIPHQPTCLHKGPLPNTPHIGVKVKIYDGRAAESFKSTDVVTFVGILSSEPRNTEFSDQIEVPTLHVLFISPDDYSSVTRSYPSSNTSDEPSTTTSPDVMQVRDQLLNWIAQEALGGDRDAAEWILLMSIARVQSRNPSLLQPSLTLSHFPSPAVPAIASPSEASNQSLPPVYHPALFHVLCEILPLTETLPLSLPYLNTVPFVPESKDEDLYAGALQLPKGSVLLVTEGGVSEGKLQERGLMNVHALQEVLSSQSLAYSFPFSQFSFPTDISCIVLSEGRKSAFFKTDLVIPFKPESLTAMDITNLYKSAEDMKLPSTDRLDAFRDLVVAAQRGKVHVSEATSEYIQQDFVIERQQNKAVTSEDLIRRMTVAKLYTLSMHRPELTIDIWEQAKAFDERRLARLT